MKGLDAFRASFIESRSISCTPDALGQLGREGKTIQRRCNCARLTVVQNLLTLDLLSALRNLPAVRQLASRAGLGTNDLQKLISAPPPTTLASTASSLS